jgi:hypothetical protein
VCGAAGLCCTAATGSRNLQGSNHQQTSLLLSMVVHPPKLPQVVLMLALLLANHLQANTAQPLAEVCQC